jgi:hypothetical protein
LPSDLKAGSDAVVAASEEEEEVVVLLEELEHAASEPAAIVPPTKADAPFTKPLLDIPMIIPFSITYLPSDMSRAGILINYGNNTLILLLV